MHISQIRNRQAGPSATLSSTEWTPTEKEIAHVMRVHERNREQAIEKLMSDHEEARKANAAWARMLFEEDTTHREQFASLPRQLTPDLQASLPRSLSRFADYDTHGHPQAVKALAAAWDWAYRTLHKEVAGLVLYSVRSRVNGEMFGFGCGKSHLSLAAEQMLRWGGRYKGSWVSTVDLFERIQKTYKADVSEAEYDLMRQYRGGWLILDDVGKENIKADSRGWYEHRYYQLINGVYTSQSLLLTSNLNTVDLEARVGSAAADRLIGMCGNTGFINMSDVPSYRKRVQAAQQDGRRGEHHG